MSQSNSPTTLITADRATRVRHTLRLCTAGSVDDGKSTFVNHLLHDTKNIPADQYEVVVVPSQARDQENPDPPLLVDGLRAEREQGITIGVVYRYFTTDVHSFILADCPGHEQYARDIVTGISTAEAVVLLIDARNGVVMQTKRHAAVAGLLGVHHVIFTVSKVNLLDYSEGAFRAIESDVAVLTERLGLQNTFVVPVSALIDDNIVNSSEHIPWYEGPTVLELLENLDVGAGLEADAEADLRLPIDYVIRDHATEHRGYAGHITAGNVRVGDVISVDANRQATVTKITVAAEDVTEAVAGQSVVISPDTEFDLARGDLISDSRPEDVRRFSAVAVHLADKSLAVGRVIEVHCGAALVRGHIASVDALIDIKTGEPAGMADQLAVNDAAEITIEVAQSLPVDACRVGSHVGAFPLIEPDTGGVLTAGLVRGAAQ